MTTISDSPAIATVDPAHVRLREMYDETAQTYRKQDEQHVSGFDYRNVSRILRELTGAFDRPIDALDLGCGTGRYFHCIQNARDLVGVDISPEMLKAAHAPVRAGDVTAQNVTLLEGDLFTVDFPEQRFDFICTLGVFGNGCRVSAKACERIFGWLKPGGIWFFDATDVSHVRALPKLRKRMAAEVYSRAPQTVKAKWVERSGWPPFFGYESQSLARILRRTGFVVESVTSRRSQLPGGDGYKLEVTCCRAAEL